jgi:hypothetical protein
MSEDAQYLTFVARKRATQILENIVYWVMAPMKIVEVSANRKIKKELLSNSCPQ